MPALLVIVGALFVMVLVCPTDSMPRPVFATISLPALRHNLSVARASAPGAFLWAVVKADGYGHGLENAQAGFARADGLALVEFDAATRLRASGWTRPLLMLDGAFDPADTGQAAAQQLTLVVHGMHQLDWIARLPAHSRIDVYLKMNSGMNRLGFPAADFCAAFERARALPAIRSITLMTHFADADRDHGTDDARYCFERTTAGLQAPRSLANSAAMLSAPATLADAVRPGVMLYGGTPFAHRDANALGLRAAMRFESQLVGVQSVPTGGAIGYGSTFRAAQPMRIGIVACGYADGYPRHAPPGTPVAVAGVRTCVVGRVSMDLLTVDLAPVDTAGVGAPVELWGPVIPVDEVARASGTIGYQLMCAVAPRVGRRVVEEE